MDHPQGGKEEEGEGEEEEIGNKKKRKIRSIKDGGHEWSEIRLTIEELSLVEHGREKASTMVFLSLSNLLLLLLDKVGPTMAVLRLDVQRNIERLEKVYMSDTSTYSSLVEIIKKEMNERTSRKSDSCSRAVVWLTRSMDFGITLLATLMSKDSESNLEQMVEEAYEATLKPWHGWISSAAYKVALKLIPKRQVLVRLLMGEVKDENTLKSDIQNLVLVVEPLLAHINSHLKMFRLDRLKST